MWALLFSPQGLFYESRHQWIGREQIRVQHAVELGVPLNTDHEGMFLMPNGFYHSVLRVGLRHESGAQAIDPLMMNRIDLGFDKTIMQTA